jgi:hypothetical protein
VDKIERSHVSSTCIADIFQNSISTAPSFEMDTTAGALALLGSVPKHNAVVVEKVTLLAAQ